MPLSGNLLGTKLLFAESDKQYPSKTGQTSLATAVTNFTKPVTKINFEPSNELPTSEQNIPDCPAGRETNHGASLTILNVFYLLLNNGAQVGEIMPQARKVSFS